ncbi:hypothetical protein [Roseobacter denitrificans]|nr:hypothetical protein [Roseobacter denitrificans]
MEMIMQTPSGGYLLPPKAQYSRKVAKGTQKHFTGQLTLGSDENPCLSDVESHTEMAIALNLMTRPDVIHVENQVPFRWRDATGKPHIHHFDFRVLRTDGTRIAIFVKAAFRLESRRLMAEFATIAAQVTPDFADRVVVMTEKDNDPITSHNAELLYAARLAEPEVDSVARKTIQELKTTVRIGALIEEIGHSGQGFWAVVRLLRSGELRLVKREKITHDALVVRGKA